MKTTHNDTPASTTAKAAGYRVLVDIDSGEIIGMSSHKSAKKAISEIGKKLGVIFLEMYRIDNAHYQLLAFDDMTNIKVDWYISGEHAHLIGNDAFPYYR